jgi:heat shock protein HspQ
MRQARFSIGQCIHHRLFDYRGVIIDVDAVFQGTDAWYEQVATTRPPKNEPWYRVLVHDASHETYVAERNLEADRTPAPIRHPLVDQFFAGFSDGAYRSAGRTN